MFNSILGSFKKLFTTDSWRVALATSFIFTAIFGIIYAVVTMLGLYELGNPWAWLALVVAPMAILAYQREVLLNKNVNRDFEDRNIAIMSALPTLIFILLFI